MKRVQAASLLVVLVGLTLFSVGTHRQHVAARRQIDMATARLLNRHNANASPGEHGGSAVKHIPESGQLDEPVSGYLPVLGQLDEPVSGYLPVLGQLDEPVSEYGPVPGQLDGPATKYVPVPRDRLDIAAGETEPGEAVQRFVLVDDRCDCEKASVELVSDAPDRQVYLVRLEGLKDDSVRTMAYRVQLELYEGEWRVTAAEYHTECHRGVSSSGYCL